MIVSNNAPVEVGDTVLFVANVMSLRYAGAGQVAAEPKWEEATVEEIRSDGRAVLRPLDPRWAEARAPRVTRAAADIEAIGYEGN